MPVPDYTELLRGGAGAGYFDPMGSPLLREQLRRGVFRTAGNRRRRGEILARLAGLDPNQQRQAMLDVNRDYGREVSGALNEADLRDLQGRQEFFRNLQMQTLPYQYQERNRPGFGSFLGQLAGLGVGAFTGGLGGAAAGGRGALFGRGRRRRSRLGIF